MQYCRVLLTGALCLLIASTASAAVDIVLTMDDLTPQPVDGLVHPSGVQFGFTVGGLPSTDAIYAAGGPGTTTFVQDPSIEGSTSGVLSISFPMPTPLVRFGLARLTGNSLPDGASVELFNSANVSLGVIDLPLAPLSTSFAEGQFAYSGAAVKRMTVDFSVSSDGPRFAFDNLVYRPIPEPTSALLSIIAGVFVVICRADRRRSRQA